MSPANPVFGIDVLRYIGAVTREVHTREHQGQPGPRHRRSLRLRYRHPRPLGCHRQSRTHPTLVPSGFRRPAAGRTLPVAGKCRRRNIKVRSTPNALAHLGVWRPDQLGECAAQRNVGRRHASAARTHRPSSGGLLESVRTWRGRCGMGSFAARPGAASRNKRHA
jgi:hypothetical protein